MVRRKFIRWISEITLLISGIFLILERLYIHAISFDYSRLGLLWLDPYLDHWMIGLVLVVVALIDIYVSR